MPIGLATDSSQIDVQYNAVRLDYVVGQMFSVVHDFNFLIIDACRNNPFYSRWGRPKGPGNQGLTSTRPPWGTVIAYATQENEVAIDSTGEENSPFTASLLRYLNVPDLNIFEMLTQVTDDVATRTEGEQIPSWENNPKEILALNSSDIAIVTPLDTGSPADSPASPSYPTTPQPTIPPPQVSEPTLISAATGVNYEPLQEALAAGDFRLADETTFNLMMRAAGRETWQGLYDVVYEDTNNLPCEDLNIIDQLWLTNSDGKFGLSVQQRMYQSLGGTLGEYDPTIITLFCHSMQRKTLLLS